jgi:two-component system sensor histidine kinase HydH
VDRTSTPTKSSAPDASQSVAAEKRDLLARLLARLAHEIRNPLSSLDIHVQLLEEDLAQSAPQTRQRLSGRLEIIRGELTRLEGIVKRFLRLASPSALELEQVDLERLVGHVCKLLGPEAAAREVEIVTELPPGLPVLSADGVQLTQALLNLLINALQAVDRCGKIQVRVTPASSENHLILEVQDSGPGVPPEKLAAVFEPYFTTKEEGSGLGLWIAQQIATAHGGTLQVANASEGGAVFRLRLPLRREDRSSG